ncbi:MAG TPA: hypothetical protein PK733_14495 [Clostridiales bacterium]|nr:hypothetical protein [Clostridiales bacterium]
MNKLSAVRSSPVILDACVLMVGIDKQNKDINYSFENMRDSHLQALFEYSQNIKIHEFVMGELDQKRQDFIKQYIGKNVEVVSEGDLYGKDPQYTTLFNKIARHELFNYRRDETHNRGEVYSLAYAAFHNISYFSTRDGSAMIVLDEMPELSDIELVGFEYVLAIGFLISKCRNKDMDKRLKSLYKAYCEPSIRRGVIPHTFAEFLNSLK